MPSPDSLPLVVVLIGPTAVGKTETSLYLAEKLDAEIISTDSRLLYRGMDIGTAKPSFAERARVPHHLIDVADPDETWNLAEYQKAALDCIDGIHKRGRLALLVGGTGQYVKAIVQGWRPPEVESDPRLRLVLQAWGERIGARALYDRLAVIDPDAAAVIEYQNMRRTIRALEVIFTTGRRFSAQRTLEPPPFRFLTIGLSRPRDELYQRVDQRIEAMFADGLLDEVALLLAKGYGPELPSMSAIGYRESVRCISGEIDVETAKMEMRRSTRTFVRRQNAWFKPDAPDIHWFQAGESAANQILGLIDESNP